LKTADTEYNNPRTFLVFVYNDKFNSALQCVLKMEIESVVCIYTKSRVGLKMEQTLNLDGDKSRRVVVYSSNKRIRDYQKDPQSLFQILTPIAILRRLLKQLMKCK
jgi:hypothetical protein